MRNILILSVMNRKQDSCTLSNDYDNNWEENRWISDNGTLIAVPIYTIMSYGEMDV
jgi:hypothetical protein